MSVLFSSLVVVYFAFLDSGAISCELCGIFSLFALEPYYLLEKVDFSFGIKHDNLIKIAQLSFELL